MTSWEERDREFIMPTYTKQKLPIAIARGEGNSLYDTEGNQYLDLFTGLAVNTLGHSHPKIIATLKDQAEKFLHISNVYYNPPAIQLAEKLSKATNQGKVFFTNSGTEATEAFVKWLHKYERETTSGHSGIVVLRQSFHGRTLGALKLTRQPHVYQDFPYSDIPVYEVEPENLEQLEAALENKPAAVLMEPVLGSAGILPLSQFFMEKAYQLCRENDVLFCLDEIQTGMGRTGELFAYQHYHIDPDAILFAKGIGGGLPLGGMIVADRFSGLFQTGDHGTTFAPSPMAAALGNTVLEVLTDDGVMQTAAEQAVYLWDALEHLQQTSTVVEEVRGKGLMLGVVLNGDADAIRQVRETMLKKGFLIDVTQKTIIRLLPPLTITREEIDTFVQAFAETIEHVVQ